jgi:hypothetical protein
MEHLLPVECEGAELDPSDQLSVSNKSQSCAANANRFGFTAFLQLMEIQATHSSTPRHPESCANALNILSAYNSFVRVEYTDWDGSWTIVLKN